MIPDDYGFGFRVLGPTTESRRSVVWGNAFRAHAECDPRAACERGSYLSAFTFAQDFDDYLATTGSTAGFSGMCWAPWLWFDIDRAELADALDAARRIAVALADGFGVDDAVQLWFFSGAKGFHCGIPTALWEPLPSVDFHRVCRRFAEGIAEAAGVPIDTGVYDKVRIFRAPNSRHPKTGRHKVYLSVDELLHLSVQAILDLAAKPREFEIPDVPTMSTDFLVAHWDQAGGQVRDQAAAAEHRRVAVANGTAAPRLNKLTRDFICAGAPPGTSGTVEENRELGAGRHRRLYSAAANLAELGAPLPLCVALLEESALDCGLSPTDVRRAIENGWAGTRPASVETIKETPAPIVTDLAKTRANVPHLDFIGRVAANLEARRALMAAQAVAQS